MNKLVILTWLAVFLLDYFGIKLKIIDQRFTWLPEILTILVFVAVAVKSTKGMATRLPKPYKIYIGLFALLCIIGIVLNTVPAGVLVAGIRNYFKYLPFFLLPFAFRFSSRDLKIQSIWLCLLIGIQVPLALFQRLVQFRGVLSGDPISGTVGISSLLTVLMVCSIALVVSLYIKRRISKKLMLILSVYLIIPCTLNETKSSLVFIPLAFVAPFFLVPGREKRFGQLVLISLVAGVALTGFVAVYDHFMKPRWGYGVSEFFVGEGKLERYLYRDVEADENFEHMGRVDGWVLAWTILSEDPLKLIFGLGIGNVSSSFIAGLNGEYYAEYAKYGTGTTTIAFLMWEMGLAGLLLHFWILFRIYKDAKVLSRADGYIGALGLAWMTITIIVFISLGYKRFFYSNLMGYMYWYFSGIVIVEAIKLRKQYAARREVQ